MSTQFIHYSPQGSSSSTQPAPSSSTSIAGYQPRPPSSTTPTTAPQQTGSTSRTTVPPSNNNKGKAPMIPASSGNADWQKELVKLAKMAELKKHALTVQLETSNLIAVHATLEEEQKAIEDSKAEKNRLESERTRLLECLRQVNEDRDKADLLLNDLAQKQTQTRTQITALTSPQSQYAKSKAEADRLQRDLGQPPLPSLQSVLEERVGKYLTERRLNGQAPAAAPTVKRAGGDTPEGQPTAKRGRGRPRKVRPEGE